MNDFKWRHFEGEIILLCVRWYCRYGISYRDLKEMMEERGIDIHHTTIYRWVQHYAPEMEKRLRYYWRHCFDKTWQVDETYIKVKGQWKYLYRAIDSKGRTIEFYLSHTRGLEAAKRFLGKLMKNHLHASGKPTILNTDKNASYGAAIQLMKEDGDCSLGIKHRQVKYLNNRIEADHGKLKCLVKPVRGFKSMKTAYATIKGFEVMRMFRKGQLKLW